MIFAGFTLDNFTIENIFFSMEYNMCARKHDFLTCG